MSKRVMTASLAGLAEDEEWQPPPILPIPVVLAIVAAASLYVYLHIGSCGC
jgi:hypothetical protein